MSTVQCQSNGLMGSTYQESKHQTPDRRQLELAANI